ncbi:MAG: HD-GYP domain-containing protein, partial [Acidimicrobiales bacterium]
MFGPTTGASESSRRSWQASRFWARCIGVAVFVAPLVAAWIAVWLVRDEFYQPAGVLGIVIWILQSIVVATVVAAAVERVTRRLLPLQVLLGMSLTFPDHAPSRFKIALRSGTLRKLKSRIPDLSDGGTASVQEAAEHAISLVTRLGKHERLTRGHTERVRAYSDLIAAELGLTTDERQKLAWAAMLHDIGKLAVPAEILNKDSRPTDAEWAILASHPSEGLALLAPLRGWLGDWLLAASEHHERWDGEGYPNGLSGLDISLGGRIVAVADAYDVITSHRSYKQPMSLAAARNELVECAGNQFDPTIVRAMLTASKSDRTGLARFAGLLELRAVSQAISSISTAPAAVAASLVALPAVLGVAAPGIGLPLPTGPSEVAFVQAAEEPELSESETPVATDPMNATTLATAAPTTTTVMTTESITTEPIGSQGSSTSEPGPTTPTTAVTSTTVAPTTTTTDSPTTAPTTSIAPSTSTSTAAPTSTTTTSTTTTLPPP